MATIQTDRSGGTEIYMTIGEASEHWPNPPDEWGLQGKAEWSNDEKVCFVRVGGGWQMERHAPDKDVWYCGLPKRYDLDDLPLSEPDRQTLAAHFLRQAATYWEAGTYLADARRALGETQGKFAGRFKLVQSRLSEYERGEHRPGEEMRGRMREIADELE